MVHLENYFKKLQWQNIPNNYLLLINYFDANYIYLFMLTVDIQNFYMYHVFLGS